MNRRGFLGVLAGAAAAIAVPELLIPKRSFFLPPPGGWRPSDLTSLAQGRRYAEALARSLVHTKYVHRANVLNAIPFREPSSELFELIARLREDCDRLSYCPPLMRG
jgi:hypothetical protein